MKQWFLTNLWWLLQLLACCAIITTNSIAKIYGLHLWTYLLNIAFCAAITAWAFTLSYQIAPTFLGAWFVAQGTLAVFGFAASLLYFDVGVVTFWKIVGAILTVLGGVLLIL